MMAAMTRPCRMPLRMRWVYPAPRFWAVKLVMAGAKAVHRGHDEAIELVGGAEAVLGGVGHIWPSIISNFTTTLCMTMMPMASTENWRPSGTP